MHLDMNDPQTTAYALGELDGSQQVAFDEHVHECESCRHAVAEIRELAATITKELATTELPAEKQPKLQPVQRQAVEQRLAKVDRPRLVNNKLFLALAASLLVAAGIGVGVYWERSNGEPQVAISPHWQRDNVDYMPLEEGEIMESGAAVANRSQFELQLDPMLKDINSDESGPLGRSTVRNPVASETPGPKILPVDESYTTSASSDSAIGGLRPDGREPASKALRGQNGGNAKNPDAPLFYTGDDQMPRAPMGELHGPALNVGAGGYGSKVTPTTTEPAPAHQVGGPLIPAGAPMKRGKDFNFTGSTTTTNSPGPAATSNPPAIDPFAPPEAGKPVPRETSLTVSKPAYETKTNMLADPYGQPAGGKRYMPNLRPGINGNDPQGEVFVNGARLGVPVDGKAKPADNRSNDYQLNEAHIGQESYAPVVDNAFLPALQNPLSTFSIDVDTASYANVRRMLAAGQRPPKDAVRIEEMVNYFTYDYAPPKDDRPFSAHVEMADCPWHGEHRLVRIGLKGKDLMGERRPACNLVFLLDVSGSMNAPNKLPLVKESMRLLISRLNEEDNVAIVVYAGASGLALPSTSCEQKQKILAAIDNLQAGGSTNGGAGIQLAYDTAAAQYIRGGVNRVILCTDGDFNVGITSQDALTKLIQEKAKGGVFLSVLGFGMGNLKDSTLEKLADLGNGNYAYIDSQEEARKVLVRQLNGTLVTIAKDVKIQVEFNPAVVSQYRLIGYENRMLKAEDFNNDKKDAGEIGAGHTVTALYEIVPVSKAGDAKPPEVDGLKYQKPAPVNAVVTDEVMTLKLRYKAPDGDTSKLIEFPVKDEVKKLGQTSSDFRFAASVAAFGMLLRNSEHRGSATWDGVLELAGEPISAADQNDAQADELKARLEFLDIVRRAKQVAGE